MPFLVIEIAHKRAPSKRSFIQCSLFDYMQEVICLPIDSTHIFPISLKKRRRAGQTCFHIFSGDIDLIPVKELYSAKVRFQAQNSKSARDQMNTKSISFAEILFLL
jgi:hypothetical protein